MYTHYLTFSDLQELICLKTQLPQPTIKSFAIFWLLKTPFGRSSYFCLRLWQRHTTMNREFLNLPDTLHMLLAGFADMAWIIALESMVVGLPDLAWLSSFLPPKFLDPSGYSTVIKLCLLLSCNKCFWFLLCVLAQLRLIKHKFLNNNAHVSTPTTTILPTTVGTFHDLNCFSYRIYVPQTSTY